MLAALLCLGPFVLVAILICVELAYVHTPGYPANSPTLPRFLGWTLRAELLVLLLAFLNVPFMPWHLSAFGIYSRAKPYLKVVLALGAAFAYLMAMVTALVIVAMIHDW